VVGQRIHDEVLVSGSAGAAQMLGLVEPVERALLRKVVPPAHVEDRHVDRFRRPDPVEIPPPGVPQPVLQDFIEEAGEPPADQPVPDERVSNRASLQHDVVITIRRRTTGPQAFQRRRRPLSHRVLCPARRRVPDHAHVAVAPRLLSDPLDRGMAVRPVILVEVEVAIRVAGSTALLDHGGVAVLPESRHQHDVHIRGESVIGGPHQYGRKRSRSGGQPHLGGEENAVWHLHPIGRPLRGRALSWDRLTATLPCGAGTIRRDAFPRCYGGREYEKQPYDRCSAHEPSQSVHGFLPDVDLVSFNNKLGPALPNVLAKTSRKALDRPNTGRATVEAPLAAIARGRSASRERNRARADSGPGRRGGARRAGW